MLKDQKVTITPQELTDDSMADSFHRHSELSGNDGSPNPALYVDADGKIGIGTGGITTPPTEKLEIVGNFFLQTDSDKILLGAGKKSSIYFDGSDLIINSESVTAGNELHLTNFDKYTFDNAVDITLSDPSKTGLIITGAVSQTGRLIQLYDSSLNDIFRVWSSGHISCLSGISAESPQYGPGIIVFNYGESAPEHVDVVGSYDHTGGAQESIFTQTAGSFFTEADADASNWLISLDQDGNIGAMAEIKTYIDANNVIVDGLGWDVDITSQTWGIFKHPVLMAGDGNEIEISTGVSGKFEVFSYAFTSPFMSEFDLESAADNISAMVIKTNANGYNSITGQEIDYISGDLQSGDIGTNQLITIDDTAASGADPTTQIAGTVYLTTTASSATKDAIVVLPGFNRALEIQGTEAIDPDYGYETTAGTSVDRVNSAGAGDDSFKNPAVNVELFDNNGDDILIGSDSTFEIIQAILLIASSKDLVFDFWYSKAGGNWTPLTIQRDNTSGFTGSGNIVFSAPDDWTKDDEDLDGNAITEAYYFAMTRTYGPVITTLPTEYYFKIYSDQATGAFIDGKGFLTPRLAADAEAPNRSFYESTDNGKLSYKDSSGSVNALY